MEAACPKFLDKKLPKTFTTVYMTILQCHIGLQKFERIDYSIKNP